MIQTGIADICRLMADDVYQKYYEKAPRWRQDKADRLRNKADRILSIGAWSLYGMLRHETGVSEKAAYNLSHSGKFVLCALDVAERDNLKVGCDVEKPGETREQLAERFFTAAECAYIREAGSESEKNTRFYRLWVLKESYVKAVGRGTVLGLHNFEIAFTKDDTPILGKDESGETQMYYFKEYQYHPEAGRIAVCSNSFDFAEEMYIGEFHNL